MADEFAGLLREAVAIDLWTPGNGGTPGQWTPAGTSWAALVPVDTAQLVDVGERRIGRPRYQLTLRTPTVATISSRFHWRDRMLVVLRADPDPRLRDRTTFLVEDRT